MSYYLNGEVPVLQGCKMNEQALNMALFLGTAINKEILSQSTI